MRIANDSPYVLAGSVYTTAKSVLLPFGYTPE